MTPKKGLTVLEFYKTKYRAYLIDKSGNISILFGVVLTLIMLATAIAIDFSRMTTVSAKLKDLGDNAAIAGAYVAESDPDNRRQHVLNSLEHNGYFSDASYGSSEPIIIFDDEAREVTVRMEAPMNMLFGGFLGGDKPVSSESIVSYLTEEITPVSISFALDVSGSMRDSTKDGRVKIDVLKGATASLFNSMSASVKDPQNLRKNLRTGMTAYNTEVVALMPMEWGWESLDASVDNLIADGGTNSTPALQASLDQLVLDKHKPEGLRRFIIFMTDGDNNQPEWDEESNAICLDAKNQGIEIYSVAFAAPEKGEALLFDCASPNAGSKGGKGKGNNNRGANANGNSNANSNLNSADGTACNAGNGQGHGYGRCKDQKSEHYFDADDAEAFEAAFKRIGEEIAKIDLRIKS